MNIYQVANILIARAQNYSLDTFAKINSENQQAVETDVNGKESAGFAIWVNGEAFNVNVTRRA